MLLLGVLIGVLQEIYFSSNIFIFFSSENYQKYELNSIITMSFIILLFLN
jgi:hypothetical protein